MRSKYVLMTTTAALVLTAAGFAQAQQAPGTSGPKAPSVQSQGAAPATTGKAGMLDSSVLHEIDDDKAMVQGLSVTAGDLADMDIYGSDGNKIGEVEKILADSSNTVKAVTVDVGGFLGMGAREVILPIDQLSKGQDKDRLQTSMTKAEIEKLDEWADKDRDVTPRTAPATRP